MGSLQQTISNDSCYYLYVCSIAQTFTSSRVEYHDDTAHNLIQL